MGDDRRIEMTIEQTCPQFTVLDHEGRTVTRESLEGQKAVLWFYPKADTPG